MTKRQGSRRTAGQRGRAAARKAAVARWKKPAGGG